MQLEEIRGLAATQAIREGILKPSKLANGWMVAVETCDGQQIPVTDDHNKPNVYHSLDTATAVLQQLEISPIKVVEEF